MIINKKKGMIIFSIIGVVAVCLCINYTNRNKSPYIKSDQIVYKTDSIEVPHVTTKEFDGEGRFHLLAQLGIGKSSKADSDRDAFVIKTDIDTGDSKELYEQRDENWAYKADGWFRNYATYEDEMLCADFISERLTYGKPTPCLAVINLETKKETLWNLSELSGKAAFSEEGEQIDQMVWLNKKKVALVSGNSVVYIDIVQGKLLELKDCIYLMHVAEYAGECSFCRIHKLVLRT